MAAPRPRTSYMSPAVFRALRESTGLTPTAWAYFLDCSAGAVANIETSKTRSISKQMAYLAALMAHPGVRALLPEVFALEKQIIAEAETRTASTAADSQGKSRCLSDSRYGTPGRSEKR